MTGINNSHRHQANSRWYMSIGIFIKDCIGHQWGLFNSCWPPGANENYYVWTITPIGYKVTRRHELINSHWDLL